MHNLNLIKGKHDTNQDEEPFTKYLHELLFKSVKVMKDEIRGD